MAKVKINLASGVSVEKNVLTAFNSGIGTYLVLDNETIGSMGLPIILISKIVDNKAIKIVDANEWNSVKENLRQIISGNKMNYINVSPELNGDDEYYTQLTLPVASFDAIKNNYKPVDDSSSTTPFSPFAPITPESVVTPTFNMNVEPVAPAPVAPETPAPAVQPMVTEPPIINPTPVVENIQPELSTMSTVTPIQDLVTPVAPAIPEVTPVSVGEPPIVETPQVMNPVETPAPENILTETPETNTVDFAADKEAFLKACENMFDALVAKFNK